MSQPKDAKACICKDHYVDEQVPRIFGATVHLQGLGLLKVFFFPPGNLQYISTMGGSCIFSDLYIYMALW